MITINTNLNPAHFAEAQEALKDNLEAIKQSGDTILVLKDETRVLVIYRKNQFLFQSLDSLL